MPQWLHPKKPKCSHPTCAPGQVCEASFDHWSFDVPCMAAPLVITGIAHDCRFWFRARHDRYRLDLDGELISEGNTDDFTVSSAIELIMREVDAWIWAKREE